MELTNKNKATGRGIRTGYQAFGGVLVAFLAGLWGIPGVPEFVSEFIRTEGLAFVLLLAALVGIPAGLISWVQNYFGK